MRILQLLLVAGLVAIGVGVSLCDSWAPVTAASVEATSTIPEVAPPADPGRRDGISTPEAFVGDPIAIAVTREPSIDIADDGTAVAPVDATSDSEERHAVTLSGHVVDAESGEPIEGASIVSDDLEAAGPTRSDQNGDFALAGATERESWVTIVVALPGFVPIQRKCDIDLAAGGASGLSFRLRRGCVIVGRVDAPTTIALSDVQLSVVYEDADDDEEEHDDVWPLRPDGSFRIDSVLPGSLVVVKACVGSHARGATLPFRIPTAAGAVVRADVSLIVRASCTIWLGPHDAGASEPADEASADPADRVCLVRLDRGEEFRLGIGIEDDRSYRFENIPAGRYAVSLNDWNLGEDGVPLGTIELGPGEDRTFDFRKPPSLRVAGRFVPARKVGIDRGCRPPDSVVITLAKPGMRLREFIASGTQTFFFASVPPGRYTLTASVDSEPLEIEAGDTAVVVREIGRGVVAGSVDVGRDARPVVVLTRGNGETTTQPCRPPESAGGMPSFEFEECGPGPLRLEVIAAGHRLLERRIDVLQATERMDLGTLHLEREADLVGTLLDERGRPLAGVVVSAIRELPIEGLPWNCDRAMIEPAPCVTDEAGRFQLPFEPRLAGFDLDLLDGEPVRVAATIEAGRLVLRRPRLHAIRMTVVTDQGLPGHDVTVRISRPTRDPFEYRCFGEATTDSLGRCTILTRALETVEWTTSMDAVDLVLDVDPFTLGEADLDLGTLVLRH